MASNAKWKEMQRMGRARFVWRERALYVGVPVGIAVSVVVGGGRVTFLTSYLAAQLDDSGFLWLCRCPQELS